MEAIISLCQASLDAGTGVTLFVGGHRIPLVVTEICGLDYVVGRNQEYGKIVVLLPAVTAAAIG